MTGGGGGGGGGGCCASIDPDKPILVAGNL